MKKINKKLSHAFMALLLVASVFIPLLRTSNVVNAAELPSSSYTLTTVPTINNNKLVDGAKYGEGKFYLETTYKFNNSTTLKNGDFMVYKVPNEFKIESDTTTDIFGNDGVTKVAELTTNKEANTATVTVSNEEYFANLPEDRKITSLFTVVWADNIELYKSYPIDIPGAGVYNLTRIVPDVDSTGFTKWGVQDANDPNYINWYIRVNRYANSFEDVTIQDTIPEGQVLASEITGYYFTDWDKAEPHPRLKADHVVVQDSNRFTITPNGNGDLTNQGLYVIYKTRITAPVDNTTKKAFNNVKITTSTENFDVEGFAPLTTTEGIGTGSRSADVTFEVSKQLNGRDLKAEQFSFQLLDPNGTVIETVKNDQDGKIKFKTVKFSTVGDYKYQIKEVNDQKPGYSYDEKTINAEVTVTDVYGEKFASVKYDNKVFVNTYSAKPAQASITAKKVLTGKTLEADKYEFELKEGNTVVGTAKNTADGSVNFSVINYDATGTHTYTITEKAGSEAGVAYDKSSHTVTVEVVDNGQGQLTATVTGNNPTFKNTYTASPAKATVEAKKVLNGKELEADKYEFELKEGNKLVGTTKNTAGGSVSFPEISYTKAGTYHYTMTEKAGNEPGITYDNNSYEVTVEVEDNGQGQLKATVTSEKPVFVNDYAAKAGKVRIQAIKVLKGKALEADKYEFELKDSEGNVIDTAKNAADGSITFKDIDVEAEGTFTYLISEKAGNEASVTYDSTVHEVTVEVVDNGQGQFVATVTGNNPTFTNTYVAKSTKVTIGAKKVLNGKDLEADKYEFELKEGYSVVATAKNTAEGTVAFPAIEYTTVGTHTYTITEKAGREEGVTYDKTEYKVTVTVADNGQGQLVTTVTGNIPTFTNTYVAETPGTSDKTPKQPEENKELPNTGTAEMTIFPTLVGLVFTLGSLLFFRVKRVK
jgi:LPXTG cell wall surface protein